MAGDAGAVDRMPRVLAACGGFLVAVLWFDLMFDVQVRGHAGEVLPPSVLASIGAYYRRVTTDAQPLTWLVATVMVATIGGAVHQLRRGAGALGWRVLALVCAAGPIALALGRVFPNAIALGAEVGSPAVQSALARAIYRDHLLCLAAMVAFVAIELRAPMRRPAPPA